MSNFPPLHLGLLRTPTEFRIDFRLKEQGGQDACNRPYNFNKSLPDLTPNGPCIVVANGGLRSILEAVRVVASTDAAVLITGETGTGKELIAKAIHEQSSQSNSPYVKLNCAAIPATLLESELFGHERGAFTGAVTQTTGRFQMADRGTIYLDEIGDLPLELQPKLLRVLQEHEFERRGNGRTIRVDVRIVAATNCNLL